MPRTITFQDTTTVDRWAALSAGAQALPVDWSKPDTPPAGYEIRTAAVEQELAANYFRATQLLESGGIPGITVTEEDINTTLRGGYLPMLEHIKALGGMPDRPFRVRYGDGQIDFLVQKEAEGGGA